MHITGYKLAINRNNHHTIEIDFAIYIFPLNITNVKLVRACINSLGQKYTSNHIVRYMPKVN